MLQCKKSILNIWFIILFLIANIIAILHIFYAVNEYKFIINNFAKNNEVYLNPCLPVYTSINMWIGNSKSIYSKMFFYIIPALCPFTYSWSYCVDFKKNHFNSETSVKYYISKFIAVFISSGIVIAIPLFINFVGISLFIPTFKPDSVYDIYYGMFSNKFLSYLFYNTPPVYIFIVILLNFVFGGLFGCLGLSISTIIKSKIIAVTSPSFILILIAFIKDTFLSNSMIDIFPISFIYPCISHSVKWLIVITEISIFLLFSLFLPITRGCRNES